MMDERAIDPGLVWLLDAVAPNRELEGRAEPGGVQVPV